MSMNIWQAVSIISAWLLGLSATAVFILFLRDILVILRIKGKRDD
ncbi:MAG: hypothetical protein QF416_00385 [Candidatus Marinimicrobia bacterium]|jgi:hypothetical protein|nr:hypothetical protein [Candidatus Neomarinimicrobiota bacterium]MDP7058916.1 hypothetical protein [Candidatus Neomarinimicrobiota bacterium]|tara:strand:+ start:12300 stop:12434 length:135 start_codon:yes stop_codon:yes gene_type:complete